MRVSFALLVVVVLYAEPPYIVMADGKVIERTPCGKKTIVPLGCYIVLVGSGVHVVWLELNKQISDYLQVEQRVQLRFTFDIL